MEESYHLNPFILKRKRGETEKQFKFREDLYNQILKDTSKCDKAIIYSNTIVNILSLGCKYPEELMNQVSKYMPTDDKNIYLNLQIH